MKPNRPRWNKSIANPGNEMTVEEWQPLHRYPFSCRGSWICFFRKNPGLAGGLATAPLTLRVLTGALWEPHDVLSVDLECEGESITWNARATPCLLELNSANGMGQVLIAFQDPETVRIYAKGLTLRLDVCQTPPDQIGKEMWRILAGSHSRVLLSLAYGKLRHGCHAQRSAFYLDGESEASEMLIHRTTSGYTPPQAKGTLHDCICRQQQALVQWISASHNVNEEFRALRDRELATLWNLSVLPIGNFKHEVTLMSKAHLVGVWSWDHCWTTLALGNIDPVLAWNNFICVFEHQDESGSLPDAITDNQMYWGYVKPPVHGWILGLLEKRYAWFSDNHRRDIYEPIVRLTEYWLRECDQDGDGIPNYMHGNDSGWDNATVFDAGVPLESPDLATWLILQQEWLGKTARRLGRYDEANVWEAKASRMTKQLMEHFWTGKRFAARLSNSHTIVEADSLALRVPLLLGHRIPKKAREWCLDGLFDTSRFYASGGLLSEPNSSLKFDPDGYWRGAVWPVTTFIFAEALRVNHRIADAETLESNYLRHIAKFGNYENYHGDHGKGVRDVSFAWTASCVAWFLNS